MKRSRRHIRAIRRILSGRGIATDDLRLAQVDAIYDRCGTWPYSIMSLSEAWPKARMEWVEDMGGVDE
jgi:hypothetical protein